MRARADHRSAPPAHGPANAGPLDAPSPSSPSRRLELPWLVRLRWSAVAAQAFTIVVTDRVLAIDLPLVPLAVLVALAAASNVACALVARRTSEVRERTIALVMAFDVAILTGLLYFTGGPYNPFSFLYLVEIALAAVILSPRWTWALVGLSLGGSALLFVDHRELATNARSHAEHMALHLRGMWVAFGVAAGFIVYFLMKVTRALERREAELSAMRHRAARQDKLAALATLAAGAAHELSTPLGTIAVVAKELERAMPDDAGAAIDDVRLIRAEVARCRAILERMAVDAGEAIGEAPAPVPVSELLAACTADLRESPRVRLEAKDEVARRPIEVPLRAAAQAIRVLLENAQDASPADRDVRLSADVEGARLRVEVRDAGSGMAGEVLARAGEPFFTTKPAGRGLGLGLFLSRGTIERLGGELRLSSAAGEGTTAIVWLPLGATRAAAES